MATATQFVCGLTGLMKKADQALTKKKRQPTDPWTDRHSMVHGPPHDAWSTTSMDVEEVGLKIQSVLNYDRLVMYLK